MFFDPAIVATLHLREKPTKRNDENPNGGKVARATFFTFLTSKPKRAKRQTIYSLETNPDMKGRAS
jgi:hypothetical protein